MKNKITPEAIFVVCLFFAIGLVLNNSRTLDRINEKQAETVSEVAAMVEPFQKFLTPTPTATATPTATPTPVPTLSPTPTPICLMSNQEYYNECVARGLITPANDYDDRITKERGGYMGPSGRETYYNLKMLGNYVMCAANWSIRPKGTILETSLGDAIVVDTGDFVLDYPYGVDLAVDW